MMAFVRQEDAQVGPSLKGFKVAGTAALALALSE